MCTVVSVVEAGQLPPFFTRSSMFSPWCAPTAVVARRRILLCAVYKHKWLPLHSHSTLNNGQRRRACQHRGCGHESIKKVPRVQPLGTRGKQAAHRVRRQIDKRPHAEQHDTGDFVVCLQPAPTTSRQATRSPGAQRHESRGSTPTTPLFDMSCPASRRAKPRCACSSATLC